MSAPIALPSLALALATQGAASAAAPVVVVLDGSAEALAALAAAAQIAGTVASGENAGELVLLTALGSLSLKTSPSLPAGTRLIIQAIPGRPDAAIVLAIDDVPTTARPMAPPPTVSTPPLPSTVLQLGTTVAATLVASADNPPVDFSGLDSPPQTAAAVASAPPRAAPDTARPTIAIAGAPATAPPSPGADAKPDLAGIVVASAGPAGEPTGSAATTPGARMPASAMAPPVMTGDSVTRAPGTVVTLRILAVQPTAEAGNPTVPALRGIVLPSPQRQSGMQIDTPAGMLRVFPAPEPAAGGPRPPPLPAGTPVALRLLAGSPPGAILTIVATEASAMPGPIAEPPADAPNTATPAPSGPPPSDPVPYRVVFGDPNGSRSGAPPSRVTGAVTPPTASPCTGDGQAAPHPVVGTILAGPATVGTTLIATPFGTLAVSDSLALPPGTLLLLALQDDPAVANAALPEPSPRLDKNWSALEATLATLGQAAPELAAHLRADLSPQSGERLAAGLMVLVAALRDGATRNWTGDAIARALGEAGRDDLKLRLGDEFAALRGIADNPATNPWQVFLLPLVDGTIVRPVRLYLKRRGAQGRRHADDENSRFVLEFELTRLGTMQLDGFVRPRRFDLVLRSHAALASPLRSAVERIFHDRVAAAGLAGTIDFATAARFDVAPLDGLRAKVGIAI